MGKIGKYKKNKTTHEEDNEHEDKNNQSYYVEIIDDYEDIDKLLKTNQGN